MSELTREELVRKTYAVVEFALPTGGVRKQRIRYDGIYTGPSPLIVAGRKAAKRNGVDVANVLRITHGKTLIFTFEDTGSRFR